LCFDAKESSLDNRVADEGYQQRGDAPRL